MYFLVLLFSVFMYFFFCFFFPKWFTSKGVHLKFSLKIHHLIEIFFIKKGNPNLKEVLEENYGKWANYLCNLDIFLARTMKYVQISYQIVAGCTRALGPTHLKLMPTTSLLLLILEKYHLTLF